VKKRVLRRKRNPRGKKMKRKKKRMRLTQRYGERRS
jgi:hypothetical protein